VERREAGTHITFASASGRAPPKADRLSPAPGRYIWYTGAGSDDRDVGPPEQPIDLIEPTPVDTAVRDRATRVLMLCSRPAGYHQPTLRGLGESLTLRDEPGLVELVRARPRVHNHQAEALERGVSEGGSWAHVLQVAVPEGTRVVGRLESNGERVTDGLRLGARAIASAILTEPIDL